MCFPDGMQNSDHVVHWPQLQPLSQTCWPHILCKGRNIIPTSILERPEVVTFQVYNLFGKSYHFTALGISNYSACDKFPKTSSTYPSSVATTMPGMMMRNKGRKPGKHLGKRLPGNIFAKHSKINKIHPKRVESLQRFHPKSFGYTVFCLRSPKSSPWLAFRIRAKIAMLHTLRLKQSRKS